jgi:outer membrane protein assembly factor BamB
MAWSPLTGLVYIPAQNSKRLYRKSARFEYRPRERNGGTDRVGASQDHIGLEGPTTLLLAWDPAANREVWRVPANTGNGGTAATAGNLVFWASGSRLLALDAQTGKQLWSAEVGHGPASPITYAIDGRQYVTIAAGYAPMGDPPRVWTFALSESVR